MANFTEPPPQAHPGDYSFSSTIQYGSPQTFSWTDNYGFPLNLVLWQETHFLDDNTIPPQTETLATNLMRMNTSYSWDGKPSQNLSLSNLFWLGMYNASNESIGPLFKSQYFNVTRSASSSSTTSSSSSSSTPTTQPITTPSSTTPSASPTPTSTTSSASPTPKSSNHVALGAGLGAGLGGAALILAVALFFFVGRKWHNRSGNPGRPEVYQLAENDTFSR